MNEKRGENFYKNIGVKIFRKIAGEREMVVKKGGDSWVKKEWWSRMGIIRGIGIIER